jgi:hypothetical protein
MGRCEALDGKLEVDGWMGDVVSKLVRCLPGGKPKWEMR